MAKTIGGKSATRQTKRYQFAKQRRLILSLITFSLPLIFILLDMYAFALILSAIALLFVMPLIIMGFGLVTGLSTLNIAKEEEPTIRLFAIFILTGTLFFGVYSFFANKNYYNPITKTRVEGGFTESLKDNVDIFKLLFTGRYEDEYGVVKARRREIVERKRADARTRHLRDRFNMFRLFGEWDAKSGGKELSIKRVDDKLGLMTLVMDGAKFEKVYVRTRKENELHFGKSRRNMNEIMHFNFMNDYTLELRYNNKVSRWEK